MANKKGSWYWKNGISLPDARKELEANRRDGIYCPCCGLLVKEYRRSINYSMVMALRTFYKLGPGLYHHQSVIMKQKGFQGNDYAKLRFWGFLKQKKKDPENGDKSASGYWQITSEGIEFLFGRAHVQKYSVVFDNRRIRFEGDPVDVKDCLGESFSYSKLMEGLEPRPERPAPQNQTELFNEGV